MAVHDRILKWGSRLTSTAPFLALRLRRSACRKLAADRTAQAVPFLVSALASSDEELRSVAEEALRALDAPEAIEALRLGYLLTKQQAVLQILAELGCPVPEAVTLPTCQQGESASAPSPGEGAWQFRNSKDGTVLAFVPEGEFLAGKQGFPVHLPAYYLAFTCVTNAQYGRFLTERQPNPTKLAAWIGLSPSSPIRKEDDAYSVAPEKENLPAVWVTWKGAAAYCKWAGLRLPTELEWEKGARGVDGRQFPWGDEWDEGRPHLPTGERQLEHIAGVCAYPRARSPYGLYQMIGGVYEWCADWYEAAAYQRYAQGDLKPPLRGEHRILRGGPWRFGTPVHLRTEYRKSTVWRAGTLLCGFRCAKSL